MLDSRTLEFFYWVAELGSFRRAAERLNTTQPAVSHRIANLESMLGVQLLNRGSKETTLTERGVELHEYAARILTLIEEAETRISEPNSTRGLIRIGVAETIVHTWLARFIKGVHENYPKLTLEIETDVSTRLLEQMLDNKLDLCFLVGPINEPSVVGYPLCRYPLAFVTKGDREICEPLNPHDLRSECIITFRKGTQPYQALKLALARPGLIPPRIFTSSSLSTMIRMTMDGIGIGVIPPEVIAVELQRGDLRILQTDIELPDLVFMAAAPAALNGSLVDSLARLAVQIASGAPATN